MTEYLMLFIISLIFAFIYDKLSTTNKHIKMFVAFFIFFSFFFIQAIRYNVGTDFLGTYTNEYYKVLYGTINNKLEWGFTFLYKFIVYFDMDKQWIFVFSSFIINFFVFKSIFEHSKSAFISLAVFFLGSFFFFSMNGIRQSIAMAIFYYSIPLIKEKNFKKYLILNCIGFLFHSSAILFIPLYFILTHKFTHMQRIITILILIVVVKMLTPTILKLISLTKYSGYLVNSNYNFAGKITLSSIVNIIVYLLFEINNKKKYPRFRIQYIFKYTFYWCCNYYLINFLSNNI